MNTAEGYEDYLAELRANVCTRCVERRPGCPPCAPHGKQCGIELHIPQMVAICRKTDTVMMDPYIDQLHNTICVDCPAKEGPHCPCPLDYLLQLAVEAIERVERRRAAEANGADYLQGL